MCLPAPIKDKLRQMVSYSKAQAILFGQWGFEKQHGRASECPAPSCPAWPPRPVGPPRRSQGRRPRRRCAAPPLPTPRRAQGISALFHGLPGTGKTLAAEAIGFDIGRPLLVVNCAQLVDKYVGESAKNIEKVFAELALTNPHPHPHPDSYPPTLPPPLNPGQVFAEAKAQEAVLVFDEAEGLFAERESGGGSTSRHDSMNVGVLLHHMETFGGMCIAITNRYQQVGLPPSPNPHRGPDPLP